ncbi:Acyl-CoA synthetase short-chain family member 3, mitochondrial, partial [Armadillidium nasatum]
SVQARDDDVINVAGHRLSTIALEEALLAHEDVIDAAVIGVKDELKGEIPCGFFVKKKQSVKSDEILVKEVIEIVRKQIGPVAAFHLCTAVKDIPKTRSGKTPRKSFADIAKGINIKVSPTIEDPSYYKYVVEGLQRFGGEIVDEYDKSATHSLVSATDREKAFSVLHYGFRLHWFRPFILRTPDLSVKVHCVNSPHFDQYPSRNCFWSNIFNWCVKIRFINKISQNVLIILKDYMVVVITKFYSCYLLQSNWVTLYENQYTLFIGKSCNQKFVVQTNSSSETVTIEWLWDSIKLKELQPTRYYRN